MVSEKHFSLVLNKSDRVQQNGPEGAYYLGPGASIQWFGEQVIKRERRWRGGVREDKMDGCRDPS